MNLSSRSPVAAAAALVALSLSAPSAAQSRPPAPGDGGGERAMLEVGAMLGAASRVDDEPTYEQTESTGLALRASLVAMPSDRWGVGLAYEHVDLGHARSRAELADVEIDRDLSTLWANVRIYVARNADTGLFLTFGPGIAWQSADVAGLVLASAVDSTPISFKCEASDSADLALSAGIGGEQRIAGGLAVFLDASFEGYRMSSLPLDGCALGAGSASTVAVRGGFAYRFDVSRYVR